VYLLNLLCMLEFYTTLLVYLFFSQWFHTFKLFNNLHFLGLAFFYIRDVFGIGYMYTAVIGSQGILTALMRYLHWYQCVFYSCNMGTHDLPDMYAQSPRAHEWFAWYVCPKPEGAGHTYQANHECPCYKYYVTLPRLIALLPIRV